MSRQQFRARRQAAFMKEAERMYEQLEDWYDKHPEVDATSRDFCGVHGQRSIIYGLCSTRYNSS